MTRATIWLLPVGMLAAGCFAPADGKELPASEAPSLSAPPVDRMPCQQPLHGDSPHIVDLSAASSTTCAVDSAGSVYCWGDNYNGQAAHPHAEPVIASPMRSDSLHCIRNVTMGPRGFGCALENSGSAWCWGYNRWGDAGTSFTAGGGIADPIPELTDVVQVGAAGALLADGTVWVWGSMAYWSGPVPQPVAGVTARALPTSGWADCAINDRGRVECWGWNGAGEVEHPPSDGIKLPTEIPLRLEAVEVVTGPQHCARLTDGSVWCWGVDPLGGFNPSTTEPFPLAGVDGALSISMSPNHACVIDGQGRVLCWGSNWAGQLGQPPFNDYVVDPVQVMNVPPAIQVATGAYHTCVLTRDRDVYCWGANTEGQIGQGNHVGVIDSPQRVDIRLADF